MIARSRQHALEFLQYPRRAYTAVTLYEQHEVVREYFLGVNDIVRIEPHGAEIFRHARRIEHLQLAAVALRDPGAILLPGRQQAEHDPVEKVAGDGGVELRFRSHQHGEKRRRRAAPTESDAVAVLRRIGIGDPAMLQLGRPLQRAAVAKTDDRVERVSALRSMAGDDVKQLVYDQAFDIIVRPAQYVLRQDDYVAASIWSLPLFAARCFDEQDFSRQRQTQRPHQAANGAQPRHQFRDFRRLPLEHLGGYVGEIFLFRDVTCASGARRPVIDAQLLDERVTRAQYLSAFGGGCEARLRRAVKRIGLRRRRR